MLAPSPNSLKIPLAKQHSFNSNTINMKRILLSLMAFTILSASLYADNGKVAKKVKTKSECCSKGCCKDDCMSSKTIYANKRGLVVHQGSSCTCC